MWYIIIYVNYISISVLQLPVNKIPKLFHKTQPEDTLISSKQFYPSILQLVLKKIEQTGSVLVS